MGYVKASIRTERGVVGSQWRYMDDGSVRYTFTVPTGCTADAEIEGQVIEMNEGVHTF